MRIWLTVLAVGMMAGSARAQSNGVNLPASLAAVQPATGFTWAFEESRKSLVVLPPFSDAVAMAKFHLPVHAKDVCYALRTYEFESTSPESAPKLKGQTTCVARADTRTRDVRGVRVIR